MKSGEARQEEEFGANKSVAQSANNSKDWKNGDRASAIRSKHSVTEQRRRSKINERLSILRELIPHSDQKRDTASFLLEVIEHVQLLQEKLQKYDCSYQHWNLEPAKLMSWRNSHWRNFCGQPQTMKNGSDSSPGPAFPIRFDENSVVGPATMRPGPNNQPIEPDCARDGPCRLMDHVPLQGTPQVSVGNDGLFSHGLDGLGGPLLNSHPTECPDDMNPPDELMIEGGTISISSVYSEGLLNSLSQALQSTGVDLSEASISVEINLGKRAQRGLIAKAHSIPMSSSNGEELDRKRQKI